MNDSIGGTVIIAIIVFFLVVVMAYMAFNVNYTKAFRMKNKIISLYKEYDGKCLDECKNEIKKYANKIGYVSSQAINCKVCDEYEGVLDSQGTNLYCSCKRKVNDSSNDDIRKDIGERYYYHIITKINIKIPIISNLMDLDVFSITGDTIVFENKGDS